MPVAKPSPRVHEHLETLRAAGLDTRAFFEALMAIRDDSALPEAHRDAIYRCVAMESYAWYLEALLGEPIDRIKAIREAQALIEEDAAAIKKPSSEPGDVSARLITKGIGKSDTAGPESAARGPRTPKPRGPQAGSGPKTPRKPSK